MLKIFVPPGFAPGATLPSVFEQGDQFMSNVTLLKEADQQDALCSPVPDVTLATAEEHVLSDADQADVWTDAHTLAYIQQLAPETMVLWSSTERRRVLRCAKFYT